MFFTLVDELSANPKFKTLLERNLEGDATGMAAITLWTLAGTSSRASLTDGIVSRAETIRIMLNHEWAAAAAQILVGVGLWHDAGTETDCETCMQHLADCTLCGRLAPSEYRFHDWWQRKYDHGAQVKLTTAKKKELQDKSLRARVWARDCSPDNPEIAPCRYCGTAMQKQDRKSPRRPEMEHVDPWLAVGASNLAMSCFTCNRTKGQRTPEEAGMLLRPAPAKADRTTRQDPEDSHPHGVAGSPSIRRADSPLVDAGSRITVTVAAAQARETGGGAIEEPSVEVEDPWVTPPAREPAAAPRAPARGTPSSDPGTRSESGPNLIPAGIRDRELSSYAGARVGGSGGGPSGEGEGAGSGAGSGAGPGAGGRRRRRRRGRGGAKQGSGAVTGVGARGRAGDVPPVDPLRQVSREGSPFRNYRGPWVDRDEQSVCQRHGQDRPCAKCEEERG